MSRGSSAWTQRYWGNPCQSGRMVWVRFNGYGRAQVDSRGKAAWSALNAVMRKHGYQTRSSDTGGYVCRRISGSSSWSNHAWGTAVDFNWRSNPYGSTRTDMPKRMRDEILALRTVSGAPLFRWGGTYRTPDTMHWELTASPGEISRGIRGIPAASPPPPPASTLNWTEVLVNTLPLLKEGARNGYVRRMQGLLAANPNLINIEANVKDSQFDGVFGPSTKRAVEEFQRRTKLGVDGVVGKNTWTKLLGG